MTTLPTRRDAELTLRQLLTQNGLPEPDELRPHEDGGILCLWHDRKVAVIVDLEDP
jgi:hypothetical protein